MSNLDERYFPKTETKYYSLIENGEVVVGAADKSIAEKWLARKMECGIENVSIMPLPKEVMFAETIKEVEDAELENAIDEIIESL